MLITSRIRFFMILTVLGHLFSCHEQTKQKAGTLAIDTFDQPRNQSSGKYRPTHPLLTMETIDTLSDDELLSTAFNRLLEKLPDDYTKSYETVISWSKAQQAIYMIQILEAEVNNGGFNQYYFNSSGQYATATPGALTLIGAAQYADLVTRANAVYENEHDVITKQQDGTLEGFSKSYDNNPLNKFDHEFYELEKVENLQKLQAAFIRKHKSEFINT